MSNTPKVYLVQIGKQALLENIVNIWGYCDMTYFPDTKEQNHTEKWWTEYSGGVEHPDRLMLNTLTCEIEQAFRRN